jgi:hypothetical protein
MEAKPVACRLYPFTLTASSAGWLASLRFDCPSAARSQGRDLPAYSAFLEAIRHEIPGPKTTPDAVMHLKRGRPASAQEVDRLIGQLDVRLRQRRRSLEERLVRGASLVDTLHTANLAAVRDERFAELVELLSFDVPRMTDETIPEEPTPRQQALFRQLVFAHTEHVSLAEVRSRRTRFTRRLRQLGMSRRFRRGHGLVPPLPGSNLTTRFSDVASVGPAREEADAITSMAIRFVRMRLLSRHQFGRPYYGWPVLDGLRALWASVAVLGWLARYFAAGRGDDRCLTRDVVAGLAYVDGALGRAPSLGTRVERWRIECLSSDNGIARLLRQWRLVAEGGK